MEQQYIEVYDFIATYKAQHGYSPSLADIAEGLDLSQGAVFHLMEQMEGEGMIVQPRGFLRAIRLLSREPKGARVEHQRSA